MKHLIHEEILAAITSNKAYSFIFDGTTDGSKQEACKVILRYVELSGECGPTVKKRVFEVFTTSATNLTNIIIKCLESGQAEWTWLVSQSYDGASNLRGAISGLQAQIGQLSPKYIYSWCHAQLLIYRTNLDEFGY